LTELYDKLRALAPSLMQEAQAAKAEGDAAERIEKLARSVPVVGEKDIDLLDTGVREFTSARDPSVTYQVTFGRAGHLECTCEGFKWRGECKHVREVRSQVFDAEQSVGQGA